MDEVWNQRDEYLLGVFPADMVEQLEGLVGEIQRVSFVQEQVVCAAGEDHLGDRLLWQSDAYRRAQRSLRSILGAHLDEAAEPLEITLRSRFAGVESFEVEA